MEHNNSTKDLDVSLNSINNEDDAERIQSSKKGAIRFFMVNDEYRFSCWLKALKIRYWIDFGNQDNYKVDWVCKTDDSGNLVDLIIHLRQIQEDLEFSLLFTITAYVSKRKLMIQGNYRDFWGNVEFGKLRSLVNGLFETDLNSSAISELYSSIFDDTSNLNLEGVCLSAMLDDLSDNEDISPGPEFSTGKEVHTPKVKSKAGLMKSKCRSTTKAKALFSRSTPLTRKAFPVKPKEDINDKVMADYAQLFSSRLANVEEVVNKVESHVCDLEFYKVQFNNIVSKELSDLKTELFDMVQVRIKSDLIALKNTYDSHKQEVESRILKAESEVKKMQGRVGSLVE
jgi:hypothetical protein